MADNLPQEMWFEILHRLPLKSIVRCTSVCKLWRNLITEPFFISHHLHHSPSPRFLLVLPSFFPQQFFLHHDDPILSDAASTLHFPPDFKNHMSFNSITHGLVLCDHYISGFFDSIFIFNPSLRRLLILPKTRNLFSLCHVAVGFGFDTRTQDYKVVRIGSIMDDKSLGLLAPLVEVYSLESGVWKDVNSVPVFTLSGDWRRTQNGYVNGVAHWVVRYKVGEAWTYSVLYFCFEDEVFREVLLPPSLQVCASFGDDVEVVGGGKYLTVYHLSGGDSTRSGDIWVMKEYGVVESWNKVFSLNWISTENRFEVPSWGIIVNGVVEPPVASYVRSNGQILFLLDTEEDGGLYSLDIESKTFIEFPVPPERDRFFLCLGYYKESLVMLNNARGVLSY